MPPRKNKQVVAQPSDVEEVHEDNQLAKVDVQYNPDIVKSLLDDLEAQVNIKCSQIQRDSDAMVVSLRGFFSMELCKLPKSVQEMDLNQFKIEFGESLEQATRGMIMQKVPVVPKANYKENASQKVFETPRGKGIAKVMETPSTRRNPREGEVILSANGSPLGEFQTVKKATRNGTKALVPPTPSVHVPLKTGAVVDVANLDDDDIESMSEECKLDTLNQMKGIMDNMQAMMARLGNPSKLR